MDNFYFSKFDFRGFKDFIYDLVDSYGFWNIRFYPDTNKRHLFSEVQLIHAAPNRNLNDQNGFIWAWMQKQGEVRVVSFDFSRRDDAAKISMVVDLDKRQITLSKAEGISPIEIESALKRNLLGITDTNIFKRLFVYARRHILVSIIFPLSVLLLGAYLVHLFGWNR